MTEKEKPNYTSWRYQKKCFEMMYADKIGEFLKRYDPGLIDEKQILRERLLELFDFIFLEKCETLLDIGFGPGFYFKLLRKYVTKIYTTERGHVNRCVKVI